MTRRPSPFIILFFISIFASLAIIVAFVLNVRTVQRPATIAALSPPSTPPLPPTPPPATLSLASSTLSFSDDLSSPSRIILEGTAITQENRDGSKQVLIPNYHTITDLQEPNFFELQPYFSTGHIYVFATLCDCDGGTYLWRFDTQTHQLTKQKTAPNVLSEPTISIDHHFQIALAAPDQDGEIRYLQLNDFLHDTTSTFATISSHYTFKAGLNDFDGSPYGDLKFTDTHHVQAAIYSAQQPLVPQKDRTIILRKTFAIPQ